MLRGGGQQGNLRSGTENTPMIMGLGAAADACDLHKTEEHLRSVRDYFEKQLEARSQDKYLQQHLPEQHVVNFASSPRLPNTSSVAFPKYPESSKHLMANPVLLACGIQRQTAKRTIRFSFGRETTKEDVDRVVKELKAILFLSKHGSSLMNVINAGPVPGF
ncbi:unnamed protein product [Angiostrongylus costaricensis]|uniref:Aminotran_5 domain-containing protein n=1 Tax=Angiostrongylus costaricensis TaxID=334426 RepID=A0A0R3PES4_ANGCS|nr:unnamed protein product [Angiostrongylus costaricensis]